MKHSLLIILGGLFQIKLYTTLYGTYREEEKGIQGLVRETLGKETTWKT
jgi:hypothetical protein